MAAEQSRRAVGAIDLLRWSLLVLAILIAGQASLGFAGLLDGAASGALVLVVLVVAVIAGGRRGLLQMKRRLLEGWGPLESGLLSAVVAAIGVSVWTAAGRNTFTYDSLSFHLYFAASWMDSGRLEIVPMVFGDVAPAYNPSNVELLIHLLMAPLQSGYLADCVQAPFALIAALAIHATARELDASRAASLGAALAFLLIPEVWIQSTVSMVDLAVGALFLATLPFLLRLWREPDARDGIALATAWGLFIGTKFIALPFSAPLLLGAGAILVRHRRRLGSPGRVIAWGAGLLAIVLATGGFWYLRNLFATGNPVFPLDIDLGGVGRIDGLYDAALMRQWDYHVPVGELGVLGGMLLGGGVGFALSGLLALAVRRRGPELPLAIIQLATFWLWIPYQHSRFLFGFFGVVAIAQAVATRDARFGKPSSILLVAAVVGSLVQWPELPRLALVGFALVGAGLPRLERRVSLRLPALATGLAFAAVVGAGLGPYRDRYPGYTYGPEFAGAWRWVHENVANAHVAYTGSNLPFPLYGRDLTNRVSYANVAMGPDTRVHEFPSRGPGASAEPTPYREGASVDVWLGNLRALGCDTLFVTSMFPIVQRNIEHDAEGFPVERAWADARPEIFRLRYGTGAVRIYDVVGHEGG